jgi:hypothetical protein
MHEEMVPKTDTSNNTERLRGRLLSNPDQLRRLRGKLLDQSGELPNGPPYVDGRKPAERAESISTFGELVRDGYRALSSNHASGQDGLAFKGPRFAVTDGMGGYGADKVATAFFSQFLARYSVEYGVDSLLIPAGSNAFYENFQSEFRKTYGRDIAAPAASGKLLGTVGSTLTFAEVTSPGRVRLLVIGDSPAFVCDAGMRVVRQFGEDAQTGIPDGVVGHKLGIDSRLEPILPQLGVASRDGRTIVDTSIELSAGETLVLATDYFSEAPAQRAFGNLVRGEASEYGEYVRTHGKSDDATLLVVDPFRLEFS